MSRAIWNSLHSGQTLIKRSRGEKIVPDVNAGSVSGQWETSKKKRKEERKKRGFNEQRETESAWEREENCAKSRQTRPDNR